MVMVVPSRKHFLIIKTASIDSSGNTLTARDSTDKLLKAGFWPLWRHTRCKNMIGEGHELLFYLAGKGALDRQVIATATVSRIDHWSKIQYRDKYPLQLDGEPEKVLVLARVAHLSIPVSLENVLDKLSFIPENKNRWGVTMMGGVRSLTVQDYLILSGSNR